MNSLLLSKRKQVYRLRVTSVGGFDLVQASFGRPHRAGLDGGRYIGRFYAGDGRGSVRYQAKCDQFTPGPLYEIRGRPSLRWGCLAVNFHFGCLCLVSYGLWQMAQPVRGLVWNRTAHLLIRLQPVPFGAWGLLCNRHPRAKLIVRITQRKARSINFW